MKKLLLLLLIGLTAQAQRIGLINEDTTTRPKAKMAALAVKNGNLWMVNPTGPALKISKSLTDFGLGNIQAQLDSKVTGNNYYTGNYGFFTSQKIYGVPAPPDYLANPFWVNQYVDADNVDLQMALGINSKETVIGNGTTSQFWRGDKTWQEFSSLPISSATQTALNAKENTFTKGNITSSDITVTGGTGAVIGSGVGLSVAASGRQKILYGAGDVTNGVSVTANYGDLYLNTTDFSVYEKSNLSYPSGLTYIVLPDATWVKVGKFSLTKNDVGLSNVDNTSDLNKPISTATQTALNAKENTLSKGNITSSDITVTGGTGAVIGSGVGLSVGASGRQKIFYGTGDVTNGVSVTANYGDLYINSTNRAVYEKSNLSYPSGLTYIVLPDATWVKIGNFLITKADLALDNVDNTSDANKPISSATQTALNLKANIASPTFTGTSTFANATLSGVLSLANSVRVGGTSLFGGNTYIGKDAYISHNYGSNNTAIGDGALKTSAIHDYNTAIGKNALNLSTATGNTAVGGSTMVSNSTGAYNVAVGMSSLSNNQTGSYNVAVGAYAGQYNTGGSNSFFGGYTATNERTRQNSMFLADGAGGLKIFADSLNNVGIGTTRPLAKLQVNAESVISSYTGAITTGYGNIHLVPTGTDGSTTGLTFGANTGYGNYTTVVNAGLHVQSSYLYGTRMRFSTSNNLGTGAVSRMIINENGNVGIGTDSPRNRTEINGITATPTALSSNTSNGSLLLSDGGNLGVVHGISNYNSTYQGYVQVRNNTAISTPYDYLINPLGGNVGIGTSAPSAKLTVAGATGTTAIDLVESGVRNYSIRSGVASSGTFDIADLTAGLVRFAIKSNGNVGIGDGNVNPSAKFEVYAGDLSTTSGTVLPIARFRTTNSNQSYLNIEEKREATGVSWDLATTYIRKKVDATDMGYIAFNPYGGTNGDAGLAFGTGYVSSERMRIDRNGNVGIGTSSPAQALEVVGIGRFSSTYGFSIGNENDRNRINAYNSLQTFRFLGTANGYTGIGAGSAVFGVNYTDAYSAPTNGLIVEGNVGIGLTNPAYKLTLNTSINNGLAVVSGSSVGQFFSDGNSHLEANDYLWINGNSSALTSIGAGGGNTYINPSSGNVGIGTITPNAKLEISGTSIANTNSQTNISAFVGNGMRIKASAGLSNQDGIMYQSGSNGGGAGLAFGRGGSWDTYMAFYTNGSGNTGSGNITEKMRLIENGNLGIGTTYPSDKLQVIGSATFGDNFTRTTTAKITAILTAHAGQQPYIALENNGNYGWRIGQSGTANGNRLIFSTGDSTGEIFGINGNGTLLQKTLTTTEINAITSPLKGMIAFNSDLNTMCFYNGTSWQKVTSSAM